jgi:hypothetical protein
MNCERGPVGTKKKNPNAVALGSMGGKARAERLSANELSTIGKKGAKERQKSLSSSQRQEIARKAVKTRWAKARKLEEK